MMIYYNDPVCSCDSRCTYINTSEAKPANEGEAQSTASASVVQDGRLPTSFFRLPREVRDKIYFLTSRPDCRYSFGTTSACDKEHVHQSAEGRKASWKWIILCRQTWLEACQYMPMAANDVSLVVNDDNCRRCWDGRERCVKEGMMHASRKSSSLVQEIELARATALTIKFKTTQCHQAEEKEFGRSAHNLRAVASSIGKMRSLKRVTIQVLSRIQDDMSRSSDVVLAIQDLFSALKAQKDQRPFNISIRIKESFKSLVPRLVARSPLEEAVIDSLLQSAARAGLKPAEVSILPKKKNEHNIPLEERLQRIADECFKGKNKKKDRPSEQLGWKTSFFDEDFDPNFDDNITLLDLALRPDGFSLCASEVQGPQYTTQSGCVVHTWPKYSHMKKFLPLYLEKDFYHKLPAMNERYWLIPECFKCGIVFSDYLQANVHMEHCQGKDLTRTRVNDFW